MKIQKTTKIALLTTLIALSGAACWGAAESDEQMAQRLNDERRTELFQRNLKSALQRNNGNLQETFFNVINASLPGAIDIVDFLAPYIDINAYDRNGFTALHTAIHRPDNRPAMVKMLLDKGANINARAQDGNTTLIFAAAHNLLDVVEILLDRGADVSLTNAKGETALNVAELNLTHPLAYFRREARPIVDLLTMGG